MTKKYQLDLTVTDNRALHSRYVLLKLTQDEPLPEMMPGQFAEIRIETPDVLLRRPISINYVDRERNEVWFLVALVGKGTRALARVKPGECLNVMLPLGRGFTMPEQENERLLLVGGGVGTAPLLYFGKCLREQGYTPTFLLGARRAEDLLQLEEFAALGEVYTTTEDGSAGEKGFVTQHSVLSCQHFDRICTCGPKPMMMAVARYAKAAGVSCEVSLENRMACGVGACLCCVEETAGHGNVCVCKEGPVFNINQLLWQI